ncbi:MAG: hypothetical protein HEQ20_15640 [Aphanizomenon flos-aquae KM1D3_PB]|uniref:hypothetical protein n=1 Tax=Aphanizomenon flos-aquae TaxID=1176 RepID=UPI000543B454|nr:hypothetical protein [Aphanizomenon flos-aquae]KHG42622.1 hypothetical protein OA07_04025 [Aphanizomenon flos-aquae 2012/KM1/D3]QSV71918.1 MAG: hypothetical protein HEQ20_15640 [Aphanizomenon flos-aquae KM1D3_PB]
MSESGYPGLKDEQDETRAFITNYQLPITNYQLPITHYPLPITNYLLPITSLNEITSNLS